MSTNAWTINHLLSVAADAAHERPAILAPGSEPLTYRKLIELISRTTSTLHELGIGRGDRVAMVLPNGPEMAIAFLAIAASATAAPLNPAYQAAEFDFYLEDLKPRALIIEAGSNSPACQVALKRGIKLVFLTPNLDSTAGQFTLSGEMTAPADKPEWGTPNDVGLVLHTSGTTSRPKIVPLTGTNLCASAMNIAAALHLSKNDRVLNMMPMFHIHGLIAALLAPLSVGGSVVCTSGFSALKFFEYFDIFQPTWFTAVPTMHQSILLESSKESTTKRASLRFIRSSSAALPPQVMRDLERVFGVPVIEAYGMTEAAHQMASNPLPPQIRKPGSVGIAAGTEIAIMDEAARLLTANEIGEIVIRGANVTPGYENNPQANQAAFMEGWFRTGDQGYLDEEGYLFITGRLKEIINRGGEKISPREIDEVLLDHPSVAQAVTFAVPHITMGEDVYAAVVLRAAASVQEKDLRSFALSKIAPAKVPSRIVIVAEIPKGPTGKVQRIGLHEKLSSLLNAEFNAPCSLLEEMISSIWADVLKLDQVGIDDNFFQLGGDSLRATQAVVRIQDRLCVELSAISLFRDPTVASLAKQIENDHPNLVRVLDELGDLSEEEALRLLDEDESLRGEI
jgi:acyl-CoA synthetase (AMP-forming)/AMP-acid ligase II/acyl carrier protein